ncbi:hypothetical protein U1Q18_017607 [Sarracenia purpurea var. burkii]
MFRCPELKKILVLMDGFICLGNLNPFAETFAVVWFGDSCVLAASYGVPMLPALFRFPVGSWPWRCFWSWLLELLGTPLGLWCGQDCESCTYPGYPFSISFFDPLACVVSACFVCPGLVVSPVWFCLSLSLSSGVGLPRSLFIVFGLLLLLSRAESFLVIPFPHRDGPLSFQQLWQLSHFRASFGFPGGLVWLVLMTVRV